MRISDWSSDVCSSDLTQDRRRDLSPGYGTRRSGRLIISPSPPPNCISRMTEETRPEISLLSKQPTLALPEVPTFSFDSQTNQPQRRLYYFDTANPLYYDSKVISLLSQYRVTW